MAIYFLKLKGKTNGQRINVGDVQFIDGEKRIDRGISVENQTKRVYDSVRTDSALLRVDQLGLQVWLVRADRSEIDQQEES